jgi:hypothetical protein
VQRAPELSYNWVGADADDIFYRVSLEVPKRNRVAPGREPWRVMNGDDPQAFWPGGKLPLAQLPSGRAKERGFLATANNDPLGFTADGDPATTPGTTARLRSRIPARRIEAEKRLTPAVASAWRRWRRCSSTRAA